MGTQVCLSCERSLFPPHSSEDLGWKGNQQQRRGNKAPLVAGGSVTLASGDCALPYLRYKWCPQLLKHLHRHGTP